MMDLSIPYYEDNTRTSNSSIGWFLKKGPSYFNKMLLGEIQNISTQALERGTMIHEYILQPEEFQKDYVVWDKSRPSSAQQEAFCQALINSIEIEPNKAILNAYKKAYSTRGKSDDLMLSEGLKIASTLKDYIDFIKKKDERKIISPWDVKMLEKIRQNIQSHKLANKIIYGEWKVEDIFIPHDLRKHEFHINWEYEELIKTPESPESHKLIHVNCKSLLDGITLDFKSKRAIIYDLKTTHKLWTFEESMSEYDYLRQLEYYTMAVAWYMENELEEDPVDWEFEYYIIGIDTSTFEVRVFKIDENAVKSRNSIIKYALREIAWHQENNKWDHSRSYYEGNGAESLNHDAI